MTCKSCHYIGPHPIFDVRDGFRRYYLCYHEASDRKEVEPEDTCRYWRERDGTAG